MNGLQDIKKRIRSISSTHKVTSAMKLIAAAQLRQVTKSLLWARSYEDTLLKALLRALKGMDSDERGKLQDSLPWFYVRSEPEKPHIICVLGAHKGLCGGYNLAVIHEALAEEKRCLNPVSSFIPLTAKTSEYFLKHKESKTEPLAGLGHFSEKAHSLDLAAYVLEHMVNWFANEEAGSVALVGGRFVNALIQKAETSSLFPFWESLEEKVEQEEFFQGEHIAPLPAFDPSSFPVLKGVIDQLILTKIYRTYLESEACENAARMTTMDSSKHNAEELMKKLSLQYNRARQANITNELIEIISGTMALSQNET